MNTASAQTGEARSDQKKMSPEILKLREASSLFQEAQDRKVQEEKLAALGGLVTGMAHELSTPVGIGVTASSDILDRSKRLRIAARDGTLKKSELLSISDELVWGAEILLSNLKRIGELVGEFENLRCQESVDLLKQINLKSYLGEVLLGLQPQLKSSAHRIELDCPEGLLVMAAPIAFSQILTQLVLNSVLHGLDAESEGVIKVRASVEHGHLLLVYTDNGKGISQEDLPKVFDPFFKSGESAPGTGLGLHLVHTLVVQRLEGLIHLLSEPDNGVKFTISVPVTEVSGGGARS